MQPEEQNTAQPINNDMQPIQDLDAEVSNQLPIEDQPSDEYRQPVSDQPTTETPKPATPAQYYPSEPVMDSSVPSLPTEPVVAPVQNSTNTITENVKSKKSNKILWILIGLLVVLLAVAAVFVFWPSVFQLG